MQGQAEEHRDQCAEGQEAEADMCFAAVRCEPAAAHGFKPVRDRVHQHDIAHAQRQAGHRIHDGGQEVERRESDPDELAEPRQERADHRKHQAKPEPEGPQEERRPHDEQRVSRPHVNVEQSKRGQQHRADDDIQECLDSGADQHGIDRLHLPVGEQRLVGADGIHATLGDVPHQEEAPHADEHEDFDICALPHLVPDHAKDHHQEDDVRRRFEQDPQPGRASSRQAAGCFTKKQGSPHGPCDGILCSRCNMHTLNSSGNDGDRRHFLSKDCPA
ncbi:hypothetical protein D3C81_1452230 [compost metagenome]